MIPDRKQKKVVADLERLVVEAVVCQIDSERATGPAETTGEAALGGSYSGIRACCKVLGPGPEPELP